MVRCVGSGRWVPGALPTPGAGAPRPAHVGTTLPTDRCGVSLSFLVRCARYVGSPPPLATRCNWTTWYRRLKGLTTLVVACCARGATAASVGRKARHTVTKSNKRFSSHVLDGMGGEGIHLDPSPPSRI